MTTKANKTPRLKIIHPPLPTEATGIAGIVKYLQQQQTALDTGLRDVENNVTLTTPPAPPKRPIPQSPGEPWKSA